MVVLSNAPPTSTLNAEFIERLKELTNKLNNAIQELKSHLQSLPGDSNIERLLINLGERHAARTHQLLSTVPHSADGLLTAINLVQTYLQVTEFLTQTFCDSVRQVLGAEPGESIYQPYMEARQALDRELVEILTILKNLPAEPPLDGVGIDHPKIKELLEESKKILTELDNPQTPIPQKVVKFIAYLEYAEPILKSDGSALTEAQITLLIETWSQAIAKLPSIVPTTEAERKQGVTQFLKIRRLLENTYDLLAEILRFKDPLGFRTP
jgi:hypothetical protein